MSTWNPIPTRTRPENFGPMKDASAHARFKGPCGDTMEFWLYLDGVHIREASFTTDGCDTSVACGSVAAHLCIDRSIGEMKAFKPEEVIEVLGWQEQEESHHCALLAVRTIGMAIKDYEARLKAEEEAQGCSQDSCSSECCESCSSPCDSPKDSVSLDDSWPGRERSSSASWVLSGKGGGREEHRGHQSRHGLRLPGPDDRAAWMWISMAPASPSSWVLMTSLS